MYIRYSTVSTAHTVPYRTVLYCTVLYGVGTLYCILRTKMPAARARNSRVSFGAVYRG